MFNFLVHLFYVHVHVHVWHDHNTLIVSIIIISLNTAFFIRPFYKMMLSKAITLDDMQAVVSHMTT